MTHAIQILNSDKISRYFAKSSLYYKKCDFFQLRINLYAIILVPTY